MLLARLNASGVDHLWLPGRNVDWETGALDANDQGRQPETHCSAFAAAFSKNIGVYILRPPDHAVLLLANAQMRWLRVDGSSRGWRHLPDVVSAQNSANQGNLVVAVFENPNWRKAGHIAVVRPGTPDTSVLMSQGPNVTQAGATNAISTPLARGFGHHSGAWPGGVQFFEHNID